MIELLETQLKESKKFIRIYLRYVKNSISAQDLNSATDEAQKLVLHIARARLLEEMIHDTRYFSSLEIKEDGENTGADTSGSEPSGGKMSASLLPAETQL